MFGNEIALIHIVFNNTCFSGIQLDCINIIVRYSLKQLIDAI